MFTTKLEVDRHVDNCLKKINNETERNLRCFSFAKLYFNVGDYEQVCRYISSYLSVKPKSAEGHQLLGKALEKLGKKEAALEAYRTSLQLDPKQNNLVIKVCELLASDDVDMDQSGARYFCDLAQSFDPHNPAVFNLKERLITTQNDIPEEVTRLLLNELESRPTDVNLRVRLLKHFLQHNMIKEAYKHASAIEEQNLSIFHNNQAWYDTFAEILVRFQRDLAFSSQLTWEFWFLSVSVLERLVALSLDEHSENIKSGNEYIAAVFNFDQMLSKASQNLTGCTDRQLVSLFLSHYQAQLYFHMATLIFKQAKKDLIPFKEAANVTLPVLLAAYHSSSPDLQSMWLVQLPENRRQLINRWHKEACYRSSQTGHILLVAAKDRKSVVIEKATQYSTGMWREHLFKKMFVKRDQQLKMSTSYFVSSPQPLEPVIKLPDPSDLVKYDEVAQLVYPDSLHHYIWIFLNNNLADVDLKSFEGLQYSIKNLNNCAAEALNILDILSFLYCSTLCARSKLDDTKNMVYYNQDKPSVLPASITDNLGTLNQSKFLSAAYKMYKNESGASMGELRLLLIKGVEVVRCVGHHGLDVRLLVTLAGIFEERSKNLTKQSEMEFNAARAELYWKTALPLLEKIKNNQVVNYASNRMFEYKSKEISLSEATTYIEKGKLFTGVQLMKKKEYEKALHIFEQHKDPYASFYQSQIYKHMADQKTNQNKENVTSEMRSQNIILLSRARDCLYLTLDRLREPSVDRSHPLNAQLGTEIEKMERLLSRIDPDCTNRNECDGMSDENPSSDNSVGEHYLSTYTHTSFHNGLGYTSKHDAHNNHSTPLRYNVTRQEARPSPERLDAQIRQMAASRDAALTNILEQNKIMVESHKSLLEELRSFKDAVNNLTATVDDLKTMKRGFEELKDIKKSVDELKSSVDDLQNVVDVVQEMKKEINELKKDQTKNQLSDEDLYVLDPDYGVDYNINSNIGAFNTNLPSMYPNYQAGRIGAPNTLPPYGPPGLYPGLYPGLAYAYGGLGLPQPGALPFVPDQQLPSISAAGAASYTQPILGQQALTQGLPSTSLGVGLLTGQALSQGIAHSVQPLRESPKTAISSIISSTTQSMFPSIASVAAPSSSLAINSKAPPVNVVITSSDPLPTNKTPISQPILSVTIPPQHIKGSIPKSQPHNYQIPLPSSSVMSLASTPSILSKPPPIISTQSLLSNVAPPLFSAVSQNKSPKNVSLGLQIEKTLDQTFSPSKSNISLSKSNASTSSIEEHDPCPDFKPIIPLPDEVPINTGEECETQLFCERAKLFRHVNNSGVREWKERGVGNLKILSNPQTGKVRLLMRRDQVHKICANHFITKDMTLTPMANSDRAYIWAALDFADEAMILEKFCVRFKSAEEAKKFYDSFESSKKFISDESTTGMDLTSKTDIKRNNTGVNKEKSANNATEMIKPSKVDVITNQPTTTNTTSLGGFVFTSTPTFKPKDLTTPAKVVETQDKPKTSPFSSFTFGKSTPPSQSLFKSDFKPVPATEATMFSPLVISQSKTCIEKHGAEDDSNADDFVPTAEFKPVIALPDLVEVKTGEENAEVLFEGRAKLFRYDTNGGVKEWKERGVGIIKILKDEECIRLVMRREQVHKVCCNHKILKNMSFRVNANNLKAIVWHAQDFSEGVLTPETFTVRFKTEEQASQFLQVLQSVQTSLDENNKVSSKHHKAETRPRTTSFGDKFKPAKGSWECKNCYIINEGKTSHCIACETPKSGSIGMKPEEVGMSGPVFSFGVSSPQPNSAITEAAKPGGFLFGQKPATDTWGNAFKPAEGSWECTICCLRNSSDKIKCAACETTRDGSVSSADKTAPKGISLETPGQKFTFGVPQAAKAEKTVPVAAGFGDAFKPNVGSWECKDCYVRNNGDVLYCMSCEAPKDETVPKKEANKGVNLDTPGQKFTFGMPQATTPTTEPNKSFSFGTSQPSGGAAQFSFGSKPENQPVSIFKSPASTLFSFKPATATATTTVAPIEEDKFVFGSPQKHDFEFKPRSPRRISSGQGDEESDGSYVEEEEDNIYFRPVIPLPDKVEVKTGEEEEDVLYCHRAKLFRFISGEWKERGLGDIKVLRRKDSGKLRVVMRREQVLKICLNHVLTKDVEYIPKDDKTWLFHAADFSEGEIAREQFCIRFKNPEVAQGFKKAITDALKDADDGQSDKKLEPPKEDTDDEVEIVFETKVTAEEEREAIRLGLPPKFLSYKQLPDCTCEQCKKDDEYLKELFTDNKSTPALNLTISGTPKQVPSTSSIFATPASNVITPSTGDSLFGTPKGQSSFTFSPSQPSGKCESLRDLLLKPSKLETSVPTSSESDASSVVANKAEESSAIKSFSFLNANVPFAKTASGTTTPTGNLFSGTTGGLFNNSSDLFNSSSANLSGSLFSSKPDNGTNLFSSTATTTGSVFGNNTAPAFGNAANNSSAPNIFGAKPPSTVSTTPIFGTATETSGSIFGDASVSSSTATPTSGSIFGGASVSSGTATPTGTIFGGAPVSNGTATSTSGSIFGGASVSSGSIFGGASVSSGSIFGGAPLSSGTATPTSGTIFGGAPVSSGTPTPTVGGIFGGTPSTVSGTPSTGTAFGMSKTTDAPIFGTKTTAPPTNLFGNSNITTTTSSTLFGTTTPTTGSIFGGTLGGTPTNNLFNKTATTNLFGQNASTGNIFGAKPVDSGIIEGTTTSDASPFSSGTVSAGSVFGGATTNTLFGNKVTPVFGNAGNVFGGKPETASEASVNFGNLGQGADGKSTANLKEGDEVVLKCDSGLSFASLAANTSTDAPPLFNKSGDTSFAFLGAGAPVFGSKADPSTKKKASKSKSEKTESDEEGGEAQADEEYDPHYEPIVPLPDAITVSTGEEEEEVLFNERAKVFRFDANTKEWKERGVGQMKVLYHPQNSTYRLLLRREQVHKVVLNQLIVPTLELQPMTTSDKAWMWAGYNYTEEENNLEKLAVRFKYEELAKQFYTVVQSVIKKLMDSQSNKVLPSSVQNYGTEDLSDDPINIEEVNEDDNDDEDDDDDERSIMFMKRCTLSERLPDNVWKVITMGDLQVYYDPELYAARISVNDDTGAVFSNTLIGMNTMMEVDKNECIWKAVEWAEGDMKWKTLKATFSSEVAAQEFHSTYIEGLNYAQEVGIIDEIPHEHDTETED